MCTVTLWLFLHHTPVHLQLTSALIVYSSDHCQSDKSIGLESGEIFMCAFVLRNAPEIWKNLAPGCSSDINLKLWFTSRAPLLFSQAFVVVYRATNMLDNRHPIVELALFTSAPSKVLTHVSSLFSLPLPVVMLWAITLLPPVNHACSPVTTAISGCSTVMPYQLSTDWMQQVSTSPPPPLRFQLQFPSVKLCF